MTRKTKRNSRRLLLAFTAVLVLALVASFELDLIGPAYYLLLALCIVVLIVLLVLLEMDKA